MGGTVRWNCVKTRAMGPSEPGAAVSREEREFFMAIRELAVELEEKDRSRAEERFYEAIRYLREVAGGWDPDDDPHDDDPRSR